MLQEESVAINPINYYPTYYPYDYNYYPPQYWGDYYYHYYAPPFSYCPYCGKKLEAHICGE